jgi:hypothetical protein
MEVIPIKAVVANYFVANPGEKEITFLELSELKSCLEKKFRNKKIPVYIKYHKSDLINLAKNHSESFEVDFDFKEINYLNDKNNIYLLGSVPYKIKKDYLKFFLEVNSEMQSN